MPANHCVPSRKLELRLYLKNILKLFLTRQYYSRYRRQLKFSIHLNFVQKFTLKFMLLQLYIQSFQNPNKGSK